MVRFTALAFALAGLFLTASLAVGHGLSAHPSGGGAGHRVVAGDQGPGLVGH